MFVRVPDSFTYGKLEVLNAERVVRVTGYVEERKIEVEEGVKERFFIPKLCVWLEWQSNETKVTYEGEPAESEEEAYHQLEEVIAAFTSIR